MTPVPPHASTGGRALAVVIVNYRLADHIEHLLGQRLFDDAAVVLVDNGSEPERLRALARAHGADLLELERNLGFAGAVNRAVARVPEDADILLLNPDVELRPATIPALRRALASSNLTAVTPLLHNRDGTVQVGTAGGPATVAGFVAYFWFLSHLFPGLRGVFYTRRQLRAGLPPAWLCMACLLVDARAFRRYGPVPEWELAYAEDVAWGVRASRAGARFAVLPDVEVMHEQGASGAGVRAPAALARLALREHGPIGGRLAILCMSSGLALRRWARRMLRFGDR